MPPCNRKTWSESCSPPHPPAFIAILEEMEVAERDCYADAMFASKGKGLVLGKCARLLRWWLIVHWAPECCQHLRRDGKGWRSSLEEQDMRFGLVDFIVLPTETLKLIVSLYVHQIQHRVAHLCDTKSPPLFFPKQFQRALCRVEVVPRNGLQHGFWQLHMSVFVLIIVVSRN